MRRAKISEIESMPDAQFESFLAGFFDAEGIIYFHRKKYPNFEISITNTDKEVLGVVQRFLIGRGYHPRPDRSVQDSDRFEKPAEGDLWRLRLHRSYEVSRLTIRLPLCHDEKISKNRLVLGCVAGELAINIEGSPEEWLEYLNKVDSDCVHFKAEASEAIRRRSLRTGSKTLLGSDYLSASTGQ